MSLENVLLDVRELGKGMDLIRRECSLHDHSVLKGFVQASDAQLDKLQRDAKTAEVAQHCHLNLRVEGGRKKKYIYIFENRQKENWLAALQPLTHSQWRLLLRQCLHTLLPLWHCPPFPILGSL